MKKKKNFNRVTFAGFVKKLIVHDDKKVRSHCHVTSKLRGAAHWGFKINIQLTKKFPSISHNLRGYDSHLIIHKLNKFNVRNYVIPNGLEKYTTFFQTKT